MFPPPLPKTEIEVSSSARCFLATRHADYIVVHVAMGTPVMRLRILLMPQLHSPHVSVPHAPELLVWASRVFNSKSIRCDDAGVCSDVVLMNEMGPASAQRKYEWGFDYYPIALAEAYYEVAYLLRMEGVLFVPVDMVTSLTLTHVCFESGHTAPPLPNGISNLNLTVDASTGRMSSVVRSVQRADIPLPASPAASRGGDLCGTGLYTKIDFFPPESFRESVWLFATSTDYEHGHQAMEDRRAVIELGSCAENATELHSEYSHVRFSCVATGMCRTQPSVPLRRLSRSVVRIDAAEESVMLSHMPTKLLDELPRLAEGDTHVMAAVGRVTLLALTALVIFVRSATSPSASKLFMQCCSVRDEISTTPEIRRPADKYKDGSAAKFESLMAHVFARDSVMYKLLLAFYEDESKSDDFSLESALENCLVGLAAVLARGLTVATQFEDLRSDGNARVASVEYVLSLMNLLLWAVRWFGCDSHLDRTVRYANPFDTHTHTHTHTHTQPPWFTLACPLADPIRRKLGHCGLDVGCRRGLRAPARARERQHVREHSSAADVRGADLHQHDTHLLLCGMLPGARRRHHGRQAL